MAGVQRERRRGMAKKRELYSNHYMCLYSTGELGLSDGVEYVGTLFDEDVRELYEALKKYYKEEERDG